MVKKTVWSSRTEDQEVMSSTNLHTTEMINDDRWHQQGAGSYTVFVWIYDFSSFFKKSTQSLHNNVTTLYFEPTTCVKPQDMFKVLNSRGLCKRRYCVSRVWSCFCLDKNERRSKDKMLYNTVFFSCDRAFHLEYFSTLFL